MGRCEAAWAAATYRMLRAQRLRAVSRRLQGD